jgi:hypothetical protein
VCTAHQSRQKQKLEYSKQKFGVHLAFFGKLECTKGALQNFFSVWSAQVVHSKLFGVDKCSLQKNWSEPLSTPKMPIFCSGKLSTPKIWSASSKVLECV